MPTDTSIINGQLLFQSPVSRAHQRVEYVGHACELPAGATESDVLDFVTRIATQSYSAECAPFAYRLEAQQAVTHNDEGDYHDDCEEEEEEKGKDTFDDNGEFTGGSILASCLRNCEKVYIKGKGGRSRGRSNSNEVDREREREGGDTSGGSGIRINTGNILVVVTRKVQGCFVADLVQHRKGAAIRSCGTNALARLNKHLARPGHPHPSSPIINNTSSHPVGDDSVTNDSATGLQVDTGKKKKKKEKKESHRLPRTSSSAGADNKKTTTSSTNNNRGRVTAGTEERRVPKTLPVPLQPVQVQNGGPGPRSGSGPVTSSEHNNNNQSSSSSAASSRRKKEALSFDSIPDFAADVAQKKNSRK
jgi:hypothetical protein